MHCIRIGKEPDRGLLFLVGETGLEPATMPPEAVCSELNCVRIGKEPGRGLLFLVGLRAVAGLEPATMPPEAACCELHCIRIGKEPDRGLLFLVGETGLEPATSAMSKQCSNQLSYPPERATL